MGGRTLVGTRRGFITRTALTLAGAAAGSLPFIRQAAATGSWSPVYAWPNVAIHLHLLRDGRVLSYADDDSGPLPKNAGFSKTFVVEVPPDLPPPAPAAAAYVPNTTTNLFCSGHAFLPDGRLLAVGGHEAKNYVGSANTTVLDYGPPYGWQTPANGSMGAGRWYASVLALANGEMLALGGTKTGETDPNTLPQIWRTNEGGGWRNLTAAVLQVPNYPRIFLAPDGRVFMAGSVRATRFLDTAGTGRWTLGPARLFGSRDYGPAVMYDDGKILMCGGGNPPTSTAEIIDLNATKPAWQWTGSMQYPRRHANATVLANGNVLVTGGSSLAKNDAAGAVLAAELWEPATGQWATLASMQVPRLYHSTAILLPDARVLVAGGGRPKATNGGTNNLNVEIFSPPYLFMGPRPVIDAAPASVGYGQTMTVATANAAEIARVTFVRLSSVTHTFNMNQRFSSLGFTPGAGQLAVTVPSDPRRLPPGHYLLFILSTAGVPSVARIVQVG